MSDAPDGAPALAVAGLSHAFGKIKALDEVSFTVPAGRFTALLGQNGAGKTTLFSLITRLYSNRTGAIRIYGVDVRQNPSAALAQMGVVFQQRTLDLDLSVLQNLHYHAALHGIAPSVARPRIEQELTRAGLIDKAKQKVRTLSGGQIRRVEIARALIHRPRLLLLDEPTVGLDIGSRQDIVDHARQLCREQGIGLLWATHLIDEITAGDQVVILHRGRVLADGPVEDVVRQAGADNIRDAFTRMTGPAAGSPRGSA
ncbi:ABC transporter ATP-binding protein [Reyranella sp. CPCC 100927]|uniref:ABC transporter ATP-binding protein n=1 Tax=Reyranella sp. CPCC 100927 TaxID=2599616 RepID=UPI0011B7B955|nr:ABC transporter ATP-binding protein [Reyranella sp. CPCC 100927]TWT10675.1 ATP-binding cassette domain-containing protein [Reyranella sp. CPCC 100927]